MTTNDGGPAFPTGDGTMTDGEHTVTLTHKSGGMTLRDWFAGQALAGMLADESMNADCGPTARVAYNYADAMLAERAKP